MKNRKIILFILVIIGVLGIGISFSKPKENKQLTINEILQTEEYSYLSDTVKDFIIEHYEKTGEVYLTEKNYTGNEPYLNPRYIDYLNTEDKSSYTMVPPVMTYVPNITFVEEDFPDHYDLRNVNDKNYTTPVKNQGEEGLCWAFSTVSLLETHDLLEKNVSYSSSALDLSEKQFDYALSSNGIVGGNRIFPYAYRELTDGGNFVDAAELLIRGIGGFNNSWEVTNQDKVRNNLQLEPSIVFNRNENIFEIDDTEYITDINMDLSDQALFESNKVFIKDKVYNYGGALVSVYFSVGNALLNTDGESLLVNTLDNIDYSPGNHALHLIGWDDNYEYKYCTGTVYGHKYVTSVAYRNGEQYCPTGGTGDGESIPTYLVTGTGAWLLKNSWGDSYSYVYMPYDSVIDYLVAFTGYSENSWDNAYELEPTHYGEYYINGNDYVTAEKAVELNMFSWGPGRITLYFSQDGSSDGYVTVGTYTFDYAGHKSIDLSNKNLNINANSRFKTNSTTEVGMILFTNNNTSAASAVTGDYTLTSTGEAPIAGDSLQVGLETKLKNISDNTTITYKIKNSSGEYFPTSAYNVTLNKSYNSMVSPIFEISADYAKQGTYTIETWYGSTLLDTSTLTLETDFTSINGSGTEDDPWQITNTRQFNMIRNAPYDSYILMNDLDFAYDTTNPNGLFYNDGYGWSKIISFYGNLDGNGKKIKNIMTSSGLFGSAIISRDSCKFSSCGIHDLTVENALYQYGGSGIVNSISFSNAYESNFNNLAVVNSKFNDCYYSTGGIVGNLSLNDSSDLTTTVFKASNWYADATFEKNVTHTGTNKTYLGGLVDNIYTNGTDIYVQLSNMKANIDVSLDIDDSGYYDETNHYYYVSEIGSTNINGSKVLINNVIGNFSVSSNKDKYIIKNAFIGDPNGTDNASINVNGVKSTLPYGSSDLVTITNYEANKEAFQLARSNYDNFTYYDSEYFIYFEEHTGATLVTFADKFDKTEGEIPILKNSPEEYADYLKTYSVDLGYPKSITTLIEKDSGNKRFNVYGSFNCVYDVCNNETDTTVVSLPTESNNYKFTGIKPGSTNMIIYDSRSGYLDTVNIVVNSSSAYHLYLDYNYGGIIDNTIFHVPGEAYGELPVLERDEYEFLGWFSAKTGGTEVNENTIFEGTNDITIYAHWRELEKCLLYFDTNGGNSTISPFYAYENQPIDLPTPYKRGYEFAGWVYNGRYVHANFDFTGLTTATLVAMWRPLEIDPVELEVNEIRETYIGFEDEEYYFVVELAANKKSRVYFANYEELRGNGVKFEICNEGETHCIENITSNLMKYDSTRAQYYYEFTPSESGNYYIKLIYGDEVYWITYSIGVYQNNTINEAVLDRIDEIADEAFDSYPPVYRLYNPVLLEHLYTTDANEAKVLYKDHGWGFEGVGWYSSTEGTPVYRLYNPGLSNHLYTSDANEVNVLTKNYGWVKDNDGKPVMYSYEGDYGISIFRVYNESMNGMHHLTTDENEYNVLPQYGWKQEGISMQAAWDGKPQATDYYRVNF